MENRQQRLLDDLRTLIAQRQVVIIVGAGVSMSATNGAEVASWPGLLRSGVDHVEAVEHRLPPRWADRQREAIDTGEVVELLGVAEQIARRLGSPRGGEYRRWLRESVGKLKVESRTVIDALLTLGAPLCTTNYDVLLEEASGLDPVTWRDPARFERVIRGEDNAIVHLHGHFRDPESVVLGIRAYEEVLGHEPSQTLLRALRTYKTLLFIGYGAGLSDPNFKSFLDWAERVFPESEARHYRLAKDSDVPIIQAEHGAGQRLFVLGYGSAYEDLGPFIGSLAAGSSSEQPVAAPVASPDPGEQALSNAVSAYRAYIARSPRLQRIRFADIASRAEDRDGPPALERLPLFVLPRLDKYSIETPNTETQKRRPPAAEEDSGIYALLKRLVASEDRHCLIIGGPGAGKTELGLWLLAKFCTPGESLPNELSHLLPVRIEMRQFDHDAQSSGSGYDFVSHVEQLLHATPGRLDALQIRTLHRAGRLLWLFDGMDEVRTVERRHGYSEMILQFLLESQSPAIITSRRVGCEALFDSLGRCPVYSLGDFDEAQVRTFLKNWYALEFTEAPEVGIKRRERLAQAIEQSRTVQDLSRNPLLLTLLALLNRGDELPRRRHKVFERALDLMVAQWDANKHLPQAEGTGVLFEREDRLQFLRQLAWGMYQNRWPESQSNVVGREDLLRFTAEFIKRQFSVDEDRSKTRARLLVDDLEERNQTLAYLGNHQYGFVHKTFLEYLAAEALIRLLASDGQVQQFLQDAPDPNRWEVLTLACGLLDDQEQTVQILRLMQGLLAPLGSTVRQRNARFRQYALVIRCLAEVRRVHLEPIRSLISGLMVLIQHDALACLRADYVWLLYPELVEAFHYFGPRWPDRDTWLRWAQRPEWRTEDRHRSSILRAQTRQIAIAAASQDQRVPYVLSLYGPEDDDSGIMQLLDEASLLGPWTLEEALALVRGFSSAGDLIQVHVGCHLAKKANPEILRQLFQEAMPDGIRLYLARDSLGAADQQVKEFAWQTMFRLTQSPKDTIRERAIIWLAPAAPHHEEVRNRLTVLAESDTSERVRYSAAQVLMNTDKRDWALQQLIQLESAQDLFVLFCLASELDKLCGYRELSRRIWIRLSQTEDQYHRAEALAALALSYLDDETKLIITSALQGNPDLVRRFAIKPSVLFECNDPDIEIAILEALLKLPYYHDLHGYLAQHLSHPKMQKVNTYLLQRLDADIDENRRMNIARWLYQTDQLDQVDRAREHLLSLARESQDVTIRLEAAEIAKDTSTVLALVRQSEQAEDRRRAVATLSRMSSWNHSLLPRLLEIARTDADARIRWNAAQLIEHEGDLPEQQQQVVRSLILELAQQKDSEQIQLDAAQHLGMYPVLVQLAEAARDEKIRLRASDALLWLDIRGDILRLGLGHQRRGRVYLSGKPVGYIEETEQGSRFLYDSDWLHRRDAEEISLTLPLRPEPYESAGLHPFFENLLPEGAYLDLVAKKTNVDRDDKFGLLLATCSDCAGAVEIRPLPGSG